MLTTIASWDSGKHLRPFARQICVDDVFKSVLNMGLKPSTHTIEQVIKILESYKHEVDFTLV